MKLEFSFQHSSHSLVSFHSAWILKPATPMCQASRACPQWLAEEADRRCPGKAEIQPMVPSTTHEPWRQLHPPWGRAAFSEFSQKSKKCPWLKCHALDTSHTPSFFLLQINIPTGQQQPAHYDPIPIKQLHCPNDFHSNLLNTVFPFSLQPILFSHWHTTTAFPVTKPSVK